MEWYDSYSIGVEKIDGQHKKLVQHISDLQKALLTESTSKEIGTVIKFLVEYTKTHFADEEELMRQFDFPEYDKHKKLHGKLIQEVTDILMRLKKGKMVQAYELIDFLTEWLLTHIKYEDQKVGKFVLQKTE